MKKIYVLLFLACLLLSACSSAETSSPGSGTDVSTLPASSESQTDETGADYDVRLNPYNALTAITEEYIFAVGTGAIYRIDRESDESEVFISEETHDVLLGRSAPIIATYDEALYFISPNHLLDLKDQTTIDTYELMLYRADIHDGTITQVGVVGNEVYTLSCLEGYLVAHHVSDWPGTADLPDMEKDKAFKVFVPNANAPALEELTYTSLDTETQKSIEQFFYGYLDDRALEERLFGGTIEEPFSPFRTNDAFYYLEFMSNRLYRVPLDEGDAEEVSVSDDVAAALQGDAQVTFENYDADWLYCTVVHSIFRIRKDGSEYQSLVKDGVEVNWPIDVVDGHVFYKGTDGLLYMDNEAIGFAESSTTYHEPITLEATVIELAGQLYVRPNSETDLAALGERVRVNPGAGAELVSDNGAHVGFESLVAGVKVTIYYEGYVQDGDVTILLKPSKIVLHLG